MEKKSNNSVTNVIQGSQLLSGYLSKARSLLQHTQTVRQYLSIDVAQHCSVANLNNNILILATSSAAWNHKLRFFVPELLSKLRKLPEYYGLNRIEIIQNQAHYTTSQHNSVEPPNKIVVSATTTQQILAVSSQIGNVKLAASLKKLANSLIDLQQTK